MTSAALVEDSLPVSVELLQCLEHFSRQSRAIFDDLSRSTAQQQQAASSSTNARGVTSEGLPFTTSLAALSELSEADERLAALLNKAEVHARNQHRIEELEDKLIEHELEWRQKISTLEAERKKLKNIVGRGKRDKDSIEQTRKAALKPSTLLSYARLLAPYTSAPPSHRESVPGLPEISQPAPLGPGGTLPGSILPYPTEEVMRRGILAFAEVSNIGETTEMTGVRPPSPSQLLSKAKEGQAASHQPVTSAVPVPRRPFPQPVEEEEEDIMLDLDLNPDL